MTQAITAYTVSHIAYTHSGVQIRCTEKMAATIRKAKSDGVSHIELPDIDNPYNNAWEGDPKQIKEVLPFVHTKPSGAIYVCAWLERHGINEVCKCFDGKPYDAGICEDVFRKKFPHVQYLTKADFEMREALRAEIRERFHIQE